MVSEMLLVRFLKKHWLSSGDLKFCTAGEHEWRGVGQRHGYFTVGGAQWVFCILKQKKVEKPNKLYLPLKRSVPGGGGEEYFGHSFPLCKYLGY